MGASGPIPSMQGLYTLSSQRAMGGTSQPQVELLGDLIHHPQLRFFEPHSHWTSVGETVTPVPCTSRAFWWYLYIVLRSDGQSGAEIS